ncbi:MAG TPA: hypothetical protein VLN58_11050 [Verrucomicrobiae bacterium]|nr:hypothetical protein [Verrucomicrobiae bacterium]
MRHSLTSVSRETLQMLSGAAGLIAGFAAMSLAFLMLQGSAATGYRSLSTIMIAAFAVLLGSLAGLLLRFSLTRIDPASTLHAHTLHGRIHTRH